MLTLGMALPQYTPVDTSHDLGLFFRFSSDSGDIQARRAGVVQMINYIEANSVGNAVIVFGDTNDRYTNAGVSISMLTSEIGLKDPWVELIKGGNTPVPGSQADPCGKPATSNQCEVVDKVL